MFEVFGVEAMTRSRPAPATAREHVGIRILKWVGRQDWLRFGIRSRLIRAFYPPEVDRPVVVCVHGQTYSGNLRNFVDWLAYFFGAQEKSELEFLRDIARSLGNPTILDVGSNIGQHAVYLSSFCSVVHAFEPFGPIRAVLEGRVRSAGIPNIQIHPFGLGDTDERRQFFAPEVLNTGTASFVPSHATDVNRPMGLLEVARGDRVVRELALDSLGLIKIDVEGFEASVLRGLESTLNQFRPVVFLEFSLETQKAMETEQGFFDLFPENYLAFKVLGDRPWAIIFNRHKCCLVPFVFSDVGGNVLALPSERAELVFSAVKTGPVSTPRPGRGHL